MGRHDKKNDKSVAVEKLRLVTSVLTLIKVIVELITKFT